MRLIRWRNPGEVDGWGFASPLGQLRTEMDRLFDGILRDPWSLVEENKSVGAWAPSLDVSEDEKEYTVRAEVPGVDPKEVEVSLAGNVLTIAGEKKDRREEKARGFHRVECSYGTFRRNLVLPEDVDSEKITAEHADGVLTLHIQKSKAAAPKKIEISTKK